MAAGAIIGKIKSALNANNPILGAFEGIADDIAETVASAAKDGKLSGHGESMAKRFMGKDYKNATHDAKVAALQARGGQVGGIAGSEDAKAARKYMQENGGHGLGSFIKEYYNPFSDNNSLADVGIRAGATYVAGSVASRVVGGGGLTTDSSGNTDIIGIPLI